MAKTLHPPPLIFLFAILLQCCQSQTLESNGFTLELLRREIQPTDQYFPSTIRPTITRSSYLFTIDATVGTPARKMTFIFDTGSALMWAQCKPCINCFRQDYPLFDPTQSTSFQKVPLNHPLAQFFKRSTAGQLTFNVTYESGQSAAGTAASDTFTFPSSKGGGREGVKGAVFGCMNNYKGRFTGNTQVTGIMGVNRSPLSLVGQLEPKSRRFSYCLPTLNSPVKSTFLRFGSDVTVRGSFKKTSFLSGGDGDYGVRMLGLSVLGRRLNQLRGAFSKRCVVDVGSAASTLEMVIYTPLLATLTQHFDRLNLTRVRSNSESEGDLCYRLQPGFNNFPSMTMHFQGADLEVGPENLFRVIGDRFCLALFGSEHLTLLGAYQQQNVRLIYDVRNQKLLFAKEDCSRDRA